MDRQLYEGVIYVYQTQFYNVLMIKHKLQKHLADKLSLKKGNNVGYIYEVRC